MNNYSLLLLIYTTTSSIIITEAQNNNELLRSGSASLAYQESPGLQTNDGPIIISETDQQENDLFFTKIKFTPIGIQDFLKKVYNHPDFATKILPNNPSYHLVQFLEFGIRTEQDPNYLKQVLRLFHQKFKTVEYISAEQLTKTITTMISLLEHFKIAEHTTTKNKQIATIKDVSYNEFLNNFQKFKENPDQFLTTLSTKICEALSSHICDQSTTPQHIRNLVLRFIESMVSKTLWSPLDGDKVWIAFHDLGDALIQMHDKKIITDSDDLDDLVKTLVERFSYFLSIAGSEMPTSFYEKARNDLLGKKISWLELEELEKEVTTKHEVLRQALMRGQIKAQARTVYGFISQ